MPLTPAERMNLQVLTRKVIAKRSARLASEPNQSTSNQNQSNQTRAEPTQPTQPTSTHQEWLSKVEAKRQQKQNQKKNSVRDTSGPQSHEDAALGAAQSRNKEIEDNARRDAFARASLNRVTPPTLPRARTNQVPVNREEKKPLPTIPNTVRQDEVSKVTGSEADIGDFKFGARVNVPLATPQPQAMNIHPDTTNKSPAPSTDTYGASKPLPSGTGVISLDEKELKNFKGAEEASKLERTRKLDLISQVLREAGADSMSQVKAMDRIREII